MADNAKILIVGMSPEYGGIESFLINVFRHIDKSKIEIDFLSFCTECAYESEIKQSGSKVYHITRRGKNPVKNRKEFKAFFKNNVNTYDYVWIQMSSSSNITPNIMARKYTNAKIISHSHGTSFESSVLAKPIHLLLCRINYASFMKCTDYCFACSKSAGDYLFGKFDKPVRIIKNGIEIKNYQFDSEIRNSVRSELGISDNDVIIGHAGRLCAIKNQSFILEVFSRYLDKNPDAVLIIAGNGELEMQLKDQAKSLGIQDKTRFLGYRDDFNRLILAFDIFMLPSINEGFPLTLIEAQSGGLPCLISDTISKEVSVTDLIRFESLNQDSNKWAADIEEMLSAHAATNERTAYASQVIAAGFDAEKTASDLEDFLLSSFK